MGITQKLLEIMNVSTNIDHTHPYYGGNERLIKGLLRETVHDLKDSNLIDLEVDSESYGSGYASFWDLFCYKKNGKSSTIKGNTTYTDGVAVYLCKLAPVAVIGVMERTKSKNSRGSTFLQAEDVGTLPSDNWLEIAREIRTKLEKRGFVMLESKILKQNMPFEANIQTIIGDPPYQIFDAFFHWED